MAFHKCGVTARESNWVQRKLRKYIDKNNEIYAYAGTVGSAAHTEKYSEEQIGHDIDIVLVPNKNIPLGEFLIETYETIQRLNDELKTEFNEKKVGVPFPESHIQNLALNHAAKHKKQEYKDLIGQHIIIIESKRSIENNLPSGFPVDAGKTLAGSYQKIPQKRFKNTQIPTPYFKGFHKHSCAIITPDVYSKDTAIGAAIHGIDQAQKYTNTKLVTQKELEEAKKSKKKAKKTWKKAIKELDYHTAQKF